MSFVAGKGGRGELTTLNHRLMMQLTAPFVALAVDENNRATVTCAAYARV